MSTACSWPVLRSTSIILIVRSIQIYRVFSSVIDSDIECRRSSVCTLSAVVGHVCVIRLPRLSSSCRVRCRSSFFMNCFVLQMNHVSVHYKNGKTLAQHTSASASWFIRLPSGISHADPYVRTASCCKYNISDLQALHNEALLPLLPILPLRR